MVLTCVLLYSSCKKTTHPTYPTPSNYRILGFTKVTSQNITLPVPSTSQVITENYTFSYDGNNRVSKIIYSTNDSNAARSSQQFISSTFNYSGSSITKTSTTASLSDTIETDNFTQNAVGQITNSSFGSVPSVGYSYTYLSNLLTNEGVTYNDSGTTISASYVFTSSNGDLYNQSFNGGLSATFPDSGISPFINPVYPNRDTILTLPMTAVWTTYSPTAPTTTHTISTYPYKDALNTNTQYPVSVYAYDANGTLTRTCVFPLSLSATTAYAIYPDMANRMGDYLQLESFSVYGANVYQNSHLIKTITTPYATTTIVPAFDADSKITQTVVTTTDLLGNTTTMVYTIQYETY